MAISLGDATLVFTADQTDLNAALEQIPANTEKAFTTAAESVKVFDEALDATGQNVAYAGEQVMSLTQAFRTLAVQGPEYLKQKLDTAKTAFAALQEAGVTAKGTLLQATIKVTEKEIAYRVALGESTAALREQLAAMQGEYAEMSGVGTGARNLGNELEQAAHRGGEAFNESRHSLELMGEQVGVHLPRALRSFVSEIGIVRTAMAAAFNAVAILALIQILYEVIMKVSEWYEKTFVMTEAQKALNEKIAETNKELLEYQDQIEKANRKLELLGKTASEQASIKVKFALEDEEKVAKQMRFWHDEIFALKNEAQSLPEVIAAINNKIKELNPGKTPEDLAKLQLPVDSDFDVVLKNMEEFKRKYDAQLEAMKKDTLVTQNEEGIQLTEAQDAGDTARLNAHRVAQQARLEADHEALRLNLVETQASNADLLVEDFNYNRKKNAQAEQAIRDQIAILQRDPTKNADKITELNAQLQALELQHQAALDKILADGIEHRRQLWLKVTETFNQQTMQNINKEWEQSTKNAEILAHALIRVQESAERLNDVKVAANISAQLEQVKAAAEAGVISEGEAAEQMRQIYLVEESDRLAHWDKLRDEQQQKIDELKGKLEQAKIPNFYTQEQVTDLQKNLDDAEIVYNNASAKIIEITAQTDTKLFQLQQQLEKRASSTWADFFKQLVRGSLTAGQIFRSFTTLMAQSIGQAVQAAVMGSKGFGEAMRDMLKSLLASIAGMAAAEAAKEIAYGFAALASPWPDIQQTAPRHFLAAAKFGALAAATAVAGAAIPSGGTGGEGPGTPTNLPPTPATTPTQNPTQGVNATHLAAGGLVTHPTLAIVGDSMNAARGSAPEAVLPLGDSRAMDAISTAITERLRSDIALPNAPSAWDVLERAFGGSPIHNFFQNNFKGDLIDHNNLMRVQSRMVRKGRARLVGSEALRVTRRA